MRNSLLWIVPFVALMHLGTLLDVARADDESLVTADSGDPDPPPPGCNQCPLPPYCDCSSASAGQVGHPVGVTSGRESLSRVDLVVPGVFPIQLVRRYDSQSTFDSALGYGWAFSFDHRLFEYPDGSVTVRTSCGYTINFLESGGAFQAEANRQESLKSHGDGTYTLSYPRGGKVHFSNDGRVSALEDRSRNRLEMTYDSGGKLPLTGTSPYAVDPQAVTVVARLPRLLKIAERLADGALTGREVVFTFDTPDTGRIQAATSHDGRVVEYVHDKEGTAQAAQTNGNLVEVRGLEGVTETYGYSDPNDDHNLTSTQLGPGLVQWNLVYDEDDRVIEQTRGVGGDRRLEFDYSTPLHTVVTRTRVTRDDQGSAIETLVAQTTFEYDTKGLIKRTIDELGNEVHYVRGSSGFLQGMEVYRSTGSALELEKSVSYSYSAEGDLLARSVALDSGETVTESWTYDHHWVASYERRSDSPGSTLFRTEFTFFRDSSGVPTNIQEIRRLRDDQLSFETTAFAYDANGRLASVVPPQVAPADGLEIERSYYPSSDPQVSRRGLLQEVSLRVNSAADGHSRRTFDYDTQGLVSRVTDANGHQTNYTWDARGRLARLTNHLGESTHYRYRGPSVGVPFEAAPAGDFLSETEVGETVADGEGQVRRYRYDPEGRLQLVERKDDSGSWRTFETTRYDSDDNRVEVTDATGRSSRFTYDLLGRTTSASDDAPVSNVTSFEYDATGNLVKVTDALSRVTEFEFDDLDRLTSATQKDRLVGTPPAAISTTVAFSYDAAGNVVSVTDPRSNTTSYGFDSRSRLTSVERPGGGTTRYEYDGRGRPSRTTNARGQVLVYAHFPWGGRSSVDHYSSEAAADAGPPSARTVSFTYDLVGNLLTASDSDWSSTSPLLYTFTFDALDRVQTVDAHYLPGSAGPRTLRASYDRFGNRSGLELTDGVDVLSDTWVFDDLNRLVSSSLAGGTIQFGYRDNDDLLSLAFPGPVTATYGYHPHGPVESISVRDGNAALLQSLEYQVDAVLRTESVTEVRGALAAEVFSYGFDGLDRLVSARNPASFNLPALEEFGYDDAGNRVSPSVPSSYSYNQDDEIVQGPAGTTWTFDADGNVATKTVDDGQGPPVEERFVFDFTNRLRQWERGPVGSPSDVSTYSYDPFGRRILRTEGGNETYFLWDGDSMLAEFDSAGVRGRRYLYTDSLAPVRIADSSPSGETVYNVHSDDLGTPRALTNGSGLVVWRQSNAAFGPASEVTDPDGDGNHLELALRFPGQYADESTGLFYNRYRYYSPSVGRYVSADPIGQSGGINVFAYALADPIGKADPLGLFTDTVTSGCARGRASACAALGLPPAAAGAGAAKLALDQAVGASQTRTQSCTGAGCDSGDDDGCDALYDQINRAVNGLQRRHRHLRANPGNLPATGRNSISGHQQQFRGRQANLRRLLNAANSKGCLAYRQDAWYWATRRTPVQGP